MFTVQFNTFGSSVKLGALFIVIVTIKEDDKQPGLTLYMNVRYS